MAETEWLRRPQGMVGEGRSRKSGTRGFGLDENIGNREDRKIFIFSDTSRKKGMRERACGADSSLDRGST